MAKLNKISRLYPINGVPISDEDIQNHLDSMNTDGWNLIVVENFYGWYRFFWEKIN